MSEHSNLLPKAATGIQGLDEILNGGLPQGRPTLVCGNAGCGKTLERKQQAVEVKIKALRAALEDEEAEYQQLAAQEQEREESRLQERAIMAKRRHADKQ